MCWKKISQLLFTPCVNKIHNTLNKSITSIVYNLSLKRKKKKQKGLHLWNGENKFNGETGGATG